MHNSELCIVDMLLATFGERGDEFFQLCDKIRPAKGKDYFNV